MSDITVEHNVAPMKLDTLAVDRWPIWEKEISQFDWHYDQNEMCYILEGEATITLADGNPITITEGDLVSFQKGLSCRWDITSAIKKHYNLK